MGSYMDYQNQSMSPEEKQAQDNANIFKAIKAFLQTASPIGGAVAGGALGSVIPVIGTAAGAALGGTIGAGAGQLYGAGVDTLLEKPAEARVAQIEGANQNKTGQLAIHKQALDKLLGSWRRYL